MTEDGQLTEGKADASARLSGRFGLLGSSTSAEPDRES